MEKFDNRVDLYIARSADFAKPILIHLRELVHRACPEITETIKWSSPFFDYKGPVCQMAAFKQHCSFGFWNAAKLTDPHKVLNTEIAAAGNFGRLTSLADLPEDDILVQYIQEAFDLNDKTEKTPGRKSNTAEKQELVIPDYITLVLSEDINAMTNFENFSPSKKKEYVDWITDAKTDATRDKRLAIALEWISEGKSRHWKYK
ncbi:hypothetical protein DJ568_12915 [Mucilaginibacter hurinus]|uniref:YdhG-like domain-containing protein n=1 Tax=Mucilaginibacter hurinus TaxID=2201324 RepID=A0A367GME5_9SPHI|nr:DUF1801 domain-containing protein [Mucilaginibacter hurinus]RCH54198.1 hypothetical protein DJ568_12915 [Mucilaginibacter hurinus]